jgi:hypothetical protein
LIDALQYPALDATRFVRSGIKGLGEISRRNTCRSCQQCRFSAAKALKGNSKSALLGNQGSIRVADVKGVLDD